jgi:5-methyltetrahydropteroyltriglutamate--homocysteine methyltransferase
MTEFRTCSTGPFPRPEELVKATQEFDRGRTSLETLTAEFARGESRVREAEERARLQTRTGGYLRWPDIFRPFTETWAGAAPGPLTRFFETNTFYRQPLLRSAPHVAAGRLDAWTPNPPTDRLVLPGPYTFESLADVGSLDRGPAEPMVAIAGALAEELRFLGPRVPAEVEFLEPSLVYDPPEARWDAVVESYRLLTEAAPGRTTIVWTYFGDAAAVLPRLLELPVHGVGFDLFETSVPPTLDLRGKGIGAGCLDPTTTLAEDPEAVAELVRPWVRSFSPSLVWLGPNPPLDLLPFDAAATKLAGLAKIQGALAP